MREMVHRCDEQCACQICGRPLIYWPVGDLHACWDANCVNAHGIANENEDMVAPIIEILEIPGRTDCIGNPVSRVWPPVDRSERE